MLAERELATPAPSVNVVLIRVAYAGICGSELSGYLGHNALRVPPLIMGHEFSGEIVEMGAEASAHNPQITTGQAVTVNPIFPPDRSEWNRRGLDQPAAAHDRIDKPGGESSHAEDDQRPVHTCFTGRSKG